MNYSFLNTNKDWERYLKNLLRTDDKALIKSIVTIYDNQTSEEKIYGESKEYNGIGFNRYDSEKMSKIAAKIKHEKKISPTDLEYARHAMPKYWKQLMVISKKKIQARQEQVEQVEMKLDVEECFGQFECGNSYCHCCNRAKKCFEKVWFKQENIQNNLMKTKDLKFSMIMYGLTQEDVLNLIENQEREYMKNVEA